MPRNSLVGMYLPALPAPLPALPGDVRGGSSAPVQMLSCCAHQEMPAACRSCESHQPRSPTTAEEQVKRRE